jgi:hypothetical protein
MATGRSSNKFNQPFVEPILILWMRRNNGDLFSGRAIIPENPKGMSVVSRKESKSIGRAQKEMRGAS